MAADREASNEMSTETIRRRVAVALALASIGSAVGLGRISVNVDLGAMEVRVQRAEVMSKASRFVAENYSLALSMCRAEVDACVSACGGVQP